MRSPSRRPKLSGSGFVSSRWPRLAFARFVVLLCVLGNGALAWAAPPENDPVQILDRARALEAEALAEMSAAYALEETLMTEENDRVLVFFSMPHGARVVLQDIVLTVNGALVVSRQLSVTEVLTLQGRGFLLLHATRLPVGDHSLRADVKVLQGRVTPMKTHTFTKNKFSKFIELQLGGAPTRQFDVVEW